MGAEFEDLASRFLERKGYRILDRNVRLVRKEVDIVAADGDTIVFIEVKGRRSSAFGTGSEAVGPRKQAGLVKFAATYLERRRLWSRPCRFDVIAVRPDGGRSGGGGEGAGGGPVFEHIENAFGA